eukprot:7391546-Prymnesium_polylepis.1
MQRARADAGLARAQSRLLKERQVGGVDGIQVDGTELGEWLREPFALRPDRRVLGGPVEHDQSVVVARKRARHCTGMAPSQHDHLVGQHSVGGLASARDEHRTRARMTRATHPAKSHTSRKAKA